MVTNAKKIYSQERSNAFTIESYAKEKFMPQLQWG